MGDWFTEETDDNDSLLPFALFEDIQFKEGGHFWGLIWDRGPIKSCSVTDNITNCVTLVACTAQGRINLSAIFIIFFASQRVNIFY